VPARGKIAASLSFLISRFNFWDQRKDILVRKIKRCKASPKGKQSAVLMAALAIHFLGYSAISRPFMSRWGTAYYYYFGHSN
jgi:hypothetical protein